MAATQADSTHPSLVWGLRRREPAAWEQMVQLYQPLLASWCRKLDVPPADCDDVIQEVLQAVARGIDQFQFRRPERQGETTDDASSRNPAPKHATAPGPNDSRTAADPGTFRGWLWTVTRNKILDHHRARQRRVPAAGGSEAARALEQHPEPPLSLGGDVEPTDAGEISALLRRALDQVAGDFEPATWTAFWRSTVDQLPTDVVAAELGVSPAAIRQARSRVLRRLRRQLGDQG
jgi:RNA polymerase sigma-70 factor, ECF subfamily